MNYFAHGIRFLSKPWFLAGTATPDWLSVADRKVRLRDRSLREWLEADDERLRDFAAGAKQHLEDDQWFHDSIPFYELTSYIADLFRTLPKQDDGFLPGFLGHISAELLLDRLLMEEYPGMLDEYYHSLDLVSPEEIQKFVNLIAVRQTQRLPKFIRLFREIRFLYDYSDNRKLLQRLNQVLHRVKLQPLPEIAESVLQSGWEIIRERGWELLPQSKFATHMIEVSATHRRTPT